MRRTECFDSDNFNGEYAGILCDEIRRRTGKGGADGEGEGEREL